MREFWTFVCERQNIWYRRNVEKKPPPWTKDPILRDYFFTNVYRQLDSGTQYYLKHIAPIPNAYSLVFNTLAYRYFNDEKTWDFLCQYHGGDYIRCGDWKHREVAAALTEWESAGNRVFTSAFTVTGVRFGGYADKISNVCWLVDYFQGQATSVTKQVLVADNLRTVFETMNSLVGVGHFLAYELAIDVNYTYLTSPNITEDDFVNPGPGCRRGMEYIMPNYVHALGAVPFIEHLRWNQGRYFGEYGLNLFKYNDLDLTLRNVEHSLCEFQKYVRTKYGISPDGRRNPMKTRRYPEHA